MQPVMSRTIDTASHRRSETISVKSVKVPDMSKDEVLLRQSLQNLAKKCLQKFNAVTSIFRYFDHASKGQVNFTDFAFRVEDLGMRFSRELVLQMFAFLD